MQKEMEAPTDIGYIYILGFYRDNGKENGSYYLGFRVIWVLPTIRVRFRYH